MNERAASTSERRPRGSGRAGGKLIYRNLPWKSLRGGGYIAIGQLVVSIETTAGRVHRYSTRFIPRCFAMFPFSPVERVNLRALQGGKEGKTDRKAEWCACFSRVHGDRTTNQAAFRRFLRELCRQSYYLLEMDKTGLINRWGGGPRSISRPYRVARLIATNSN